MFWLGRNFGEEGKSAVGVIKWRGGRDTLTLDDELNFDGMWVDLDSGARSLPFTDPA
jgi:hypothetical protein